MLARLTATGCALLAVGVATPARADNVRNRQWHLTTLHIAEAQRISAGSGVTVAVVDTGVDGHHVDLAGNVLRGVDLVDPAGGDGWTDQDGHGTAMASLIAGHGHGTGDGSMGIAPQAKILPIRDARADGLDRGAVAEGIQRAVDHAANVINLSLETGDSPPLRRAVEYALRRDVVVVSADGLPGGLGKIPAPARIPGVVAVSGVDKDGNVVVSASGPEVAIAAPAKDIARASKGGGYGLGTGTSDATAIVSGVVALIRSKYPDMDAANVINRLIQTADDKGPPGRDQQYGSGIVNPVRALTADVPRVDRNPLLDTTDGSSPATTPSRSDAAAAGPSHAAPPTAQAKSESPWIGIGIGLAGLVVVGATTLLLLRTGRIRGRSHVK